MAEPLQLQLALASALQHACARLPEGFVRLAQDGGISLIIGASAFWIHCFQIDDIHFEDGPSFQIADIEDGPSVQIDDHFEDGPTSHHSPCDVQLSMELSTLL